MNRKPAIFTLMTVFLIISMLSAISYLLTGDFDLKNSTESHYAFLIACGSGLLIFWESKRTEFKKLILPEKKPSPITEDIQKAA